MIKVKGAQIEVDGSYIGDGETVIVEAKIGLPSTFWIKQLYYPFRSMLKERKDSLVGSVFFAYDKRTKYFNLWEYDFSDPFDYESIFLIRSRRGMRLK